LFSAYRILSELSSDEFAEVTLKNKKPIIESLLYMLTLDVRDEVLLATANFADKVDRIPILVGERTFPTGKVLGAIFIFFASILGITVGIFFSHIFSPCPHLDKCFESLIESNQLLDAGNAACGEHALEHTTYKVSPITGGNKPT
jgi:hypothetical protein